MWERRTAKNSNLSPSKPCFHQKRFAGCVDRRNPIMKVLLTLTALCVTLGLCHGACFLVRNRPTVVDGQMIAPDGCTDVYDKTRHAFGDIWNSADCMRCSCGRRDMQCCARYGGTVRVEGCTAIVDPETCKHKFYKIDDPTTLCAFQLP